ncbi:hypothetical protein ABIE65_004753 [Constrictibacter sp. MBR-5]|jgi:hypothetical protein|uniref:PqqD family protein n=1 Tax=Constrictibacter sp. MBR-5 TaxID=3156467 RepID=UPI0033948F41
MYDYHHFAMPKNVVASVGPDVALVLNMDSDEVYQLDPVSQAFWEALDTHEGDATAVFQSLLDRFAVSEERLRADLDALVTSLVSEGLLHAE